MSYTPGEVMWLLQLSRREAIDMDAFPADSCSQLSADPHGGGSSNAEETLPVIARWVDVQRARKAVITDQVSQAILAMRIRGFTEQEAAEALKLGHSTARRRFKGSLRRILDELDAHDDTVMATSPLSMCLICGERPRVRLAAVEIRVKGGRRVLAHERHASVCVVCLAPEYWPRLMGLHTGLLDQVRVAA